jgi:hypothetical protein
MHRLTFYTGYDYAEMHSMYVTSRELADRIAKSLIAEEGSDINTFTLWCPEGKHLGYYSSEGFTAHP